jgi:hypothetical protein
LGGSIHVQNLLAKHVLLLLDLMKLVLLRERMLLLLLL